MHSCVTTVPRHQHLQGWHRVNSCSAETCACHMRCHQKGSLVPHRSHHHLQRLHRPQRTKGHNNSLLCYAEGPTELETLSSPKGPKSSKDRVPGVTQSKSSRFLATTHTGCPTDNSGTPERFAATTALILFGSMQHFLPTKTSTPGKLHQDVLQDRIEECHHCGILHDEHCSHLCPDFRRGEDVVSVTVMRERVQYHWNTVTVT